MDGQNRRTMSIIVAVIYGLCILLVNPLTAYGVKESHQIATYTMSEKSKQSEKAVKALSKLPATISYVNYYDSTAEFQTLLARYKEANNAVYAAKRMGIKYKSLKYYNRLTIAKDRINALSAMVRRLGPIISKIENLPQMLTLNDKNIVFEVNADFENLTVAEKKMVPNKAKLDRATKVIALLSDPHDIERAKVVRDLISKLPSFITLADEMEVKAARTYYGALNDEAKLLVTNYSFLLSAEAKLIQLKNDSDVTVISVKPMSSRSIKVVFDRPIADMSRMSFKLLRGNYSVATTVTWDESRKEVVLVGASNFVEGTYNLNVKNNSIDISTSAVTIMTQKIGKITINSTKLSLNSTGTIGYATYKVYDQYENDITNSYLARSINFQAGAATVTAKDGVLTITPSTNMMLISFPYVYISAFDAESGVATSTSLSTMNSFGTLSDFQLGYGGDLKFIAGDISTVFYIPYTAKDASGNPTNNYQLISAGLIMGTDQRLFVSNPNITVKLVKDPNDSNRAAIQAQVTGMDNIVIDMPVTISAMTYAGTYSVLNTTLRRGNQVWNVILYAPETAIAVGDKNVEIPFEAFDQSGNKITRASDLDATKVTFSGLTRVTRVDGSLKLILANVPSIKGTVILSAVVNNTGKLSMLTLNIQNMAIGEALHVDDSVLISAMENGAIQSIDFGDYYGGLSITDQYDRVIDMLPGDSPYKVAIATSDVIKANKSVLGGGMDVLEITASASYGGTGSITFKLFKDLDAVGTVGYNVQDNDEPTIDTRIVSLSVVKTADINDYLLEPVNQKIYAATSDILYITDRIKDYSANPYVYGKTHNGTKVVLAGAPIIGSFVDNPKEFRITAGNSGADKYDTVHVIGLIPEDATKASASALLSVNLFHNGSLHSLTTKVTSSTERPLPTVVMLKAVSGMSPGVTVSENIVTIKASSISAAGFSEGMYITDYTLDGTATKTLGNRAKFYFSVLDSYGTTAGNFTQIILLSARNAAGTDISPGMGVDKSGKLSFGGHIVSAGEEYVYTAFTSNGLMKTIKIIIE